MKTLRLLHVFPSFEVGGAQRRTATLMIALGDRYQHAVASLNGDFSAERLLPPDFPLVKLAARPSRDFLTNSLRFRAMVHEFQPDLLLTYNWGAIEAVAGGWIAGICPVVHTEDGFGPDEAAGLKRRRVLLRRLLLPRIEAMVVPSQTLFTIATERYGMEPGHVVLIVNGVDVDHFSPRPRALVRAELGLPADAFIIGAVGRLSKEKSLTLLVERFAKASLPDALLLLVGEGPERAVIQQVAERLGVSDSVRFAGQQPDPAPYYSAMDLYAMSSVTEQMPLGLLEAMAASLPVVCTAVGDSSFVLGSGACEQCFPLRHEKPYVEALRRFASSPELRAKLGFTNLDRVRQEYSLKMMIQRWDSLYQDVIHRQQAKL
jgi:glycosyltransferase involved in cell wall biosynthesis